MDDKKQLRGKLKIVKIIDRKINYACLKKECTRSCCGPFGGVMDGIEPIEDKEFCEIALTKEDSERILSAGFSYLVELAPNGHYRMVLHGDGSCTAFQDGLCSIHEIKPRICRAYPFYVDMFVGLCATTSCPGFDAGWTPLEELSSEIQAALEIYEYWLDQIRTTFMKPSGREVST